MSDGLEDDFCFELDEEGRISGTTDQLRLAPRIVETSIPGVDGLLEDLKNDAFLADCGLVKDTFWVERGTTPRCIFEALALRIFEFHTKDVPEEAFGATAGAEWWVQIKRPASLDEGKRDVPFHWDKDERFFQAYGLYLYPQLSTVTYLTGRRDHNDGAKGSSGLAASTNSGDQAPTIVLRCRATFDGSVMADSGGEPITAGALCFPQAGRHFSFDGRMLHAAAAELIRGSSAGLSEGVSHAPLASAAECKSSCEGETPLRPSEEVESDGGDRITFLVNVWLKHRPNSIKPFPQEMAKRMSVREQDLPVPLMLVAPGRHPLHAPGPAVGAVSQEWRTGGVALGMPVFPPLAHPGRLSSARRTASAAPAAAAAAAVATRVGVGDSSEERPRTSLRFRNVGRRGEDLHLEFSDLASDLDAARALAHASGAGGVELNFGEAGRVGGGEASAVPKEEEEDDDDGGGDDDDDDSLKEESSPRVSISVHPKPPVRAWFSREKDDVVAVGKRQSENSGGDEVASSDATSKGLQGQTETDASAAKRRKG